MSLYCTLWCFAFFLCFHRFFLFNSIRTTQLIVCNVYMSVFVYKYALMLLPNVYISDLSVQPKVYTHRDEKSVEKTICQIKKKFKRSRKTTKEKQNNKFNVNIEINRTGAKLDAIALKIDDRPTKTLKFTFDAIYSRKNCRLHFMLGEHRRELECDRAKSLMIWFLRTGILLDLLVTSFQIHWNLLDFSVALCVSHRNVEFHFILYANWFLWFTMPPIKAVMHDCFFDSFLLSKILSIYTTDSIHHIYIIAESGSLVQRFSSMICKFFLLL